MKIIGLGILSWNFIYFPLFPIAESVKALFITGLYTGGIRLLPLWLVFVSIFAEFFLGLPYIYVIIRSLITTKPSAIQKYVLSLPHQTFSIVQIKNKHETFWSIFSLIIISLIKVTVGFILAYCSRSYGTLQYENRDPLLTLSTLYYNLAPVTFLTINVINFFYLHLPLFKHQKCALIIIIIGMIIEISPNMQYEMFRSIKIPLFSLVYILNAIQFVCEKWLMNQKYYTVFGLLFYEGFIGLITCIVIGYIIEAFPDSETVTTQLFGGSTEMWEDIRKCFDTQTTAWNLIGMISMNCFSSFSMMQIKYHYTPIHCGIANFISGLCVWIVLMVQNMTITVNAEIIAFGHLFGLIGILIYTEIFILYFFGLETNTTKEINQRSREEFAQDRNDSFLVAEMETIGKELIEGINN